MRRSAIRPPRNGDDGTRRAVRHVESTPPVNVGRTGANTRSGSSSQRSSATAREFQIAASVRGDVDRSGEAAGGGIALFGQLDDEDGDVISVTVVDTVSTNSAQISNYQPPTTENDSEDEDSDSGSEDGILGDGVVAEAVQENADDVPHTFVRPPPPSWDKQEIVFEDTECDPDPVHELCSVLTERKNGRVNKDLEKKLVAQLFTLSCGLVMDEISTNHGQMKGGHLHALIYQTFRNHITTFPGRVYAQTTLLSHLEHIIPQGAGWPAAYDYFWKNEFSKPQIRTNRELSEEDKINRFGKLVHDTYRTSKSFIAANLVLLYQKHIDKLPSGRTKEQLPRALRKSLFIVEINRNAKNAAKQKLSRERQLRPSLITADEAETITTAWFYEVRGRLWQKQDQNWYPDCWLLFLMLGVAAPDEAVILKSFAGLQSVTE